MCNRVCGCCLLPVWLGMQQPVWLLPQSILFKSYWEFMWLDMRLPLWQLLLE